MPAKETLNVRDEGAVLFAEINAPPMNLLGPELVADLVSVIQRAEGDDAVQDLVFTSADPDYFISHVDVTRIRENRESAVKLTGEPSLALLFHHLSASQVVTIAQIEGRVRGGRCLRAPADRIGAPRLETPQGGGGAPPRPGRTGRTARGGPPRAAKVAT